jgi:hypothetical protein
MLSVGEFSSPGCASKLEGTTFSSRVLNRRRKAVLEAGVNVIRWYDTQREWDATETRLTQAECEAGVLRPPGLSLAGPRRAR